jgi:hypothetical protein
MVLAAAVAALSATSVSFAESATLGAEADIDIRSEIVEYDAYNRDVLLVKQYSTDPDWGISAKAYVRFMLPADFGTVNTANFEMTRAFIGPWAFNYNILGLNDGLADEFFTEAENDDIGVNWHTAPANDPTTTNTMLASDTTALGSWQVLKPDQGGVAGDKYSINTSGLVNFLNLDSDGFVTLGIVRDGVSTSTDQWASKENLTYDGPELTLDYTPIAVDWAASASDRWSDWRQGRAGSMPTAAWSYFVRYSGSVAEYDTYRDAGLNMVNVPRKELPGYPDPSAQYSNAVTAGGVGIILGQYENLHENPIELAKTVAQAEASGGAVIGYMLEDEPLPDEFASLAEAHKYIYRYDQSGALPMANLLPNWAWNTARQTTYGVDYDGYVQQYIDEVNPAVLIHTHYPTLLDGTDRPEYYGNLELFRDKGLASDIGVMGFVLVTDHTVAGPYRRPSESDIRWQAYSHLAYGAKGIYYYNYRIGDENFGEGLVDDATGLPNQSYADVAANNADIQLIADKLMALESTGVFHTGASVPADTTQYTSLVDSVLDDVFGDEYLIGEFTNSDDLGDTDSYVMLVNKRHGAGLDSDDVSLLDMAQFTIDAGLGSVFAYDPFTGIESELFSSDNVNIGGTLYDDVFSILLNGGQGILLRIEAGLLEGDLDGDGFVGISDLNLVLGNWNKSVPPGNPLADPTGDGFVGISDLNMVLGNWNAGTPPTATAIPEPATMTLLCIGGVVMLRHRR